MREGDKTHKTRTGWKEAAAFVEPGVRHLLNGRIVLVVIVTGILKINDYKHSIKEVKRSIQEFFCISPLKFSTLQVRLSESVISSILWVVLVLMLIDETGCTLSKAVRQCLFFFLRSISCKWLSFDGGSAFAHCVCNLKHHPCIIYTTKHLPYLELMGLCVWFCCLEAAEEDRRTFLRPAPGTASIENLHSRLK